MSSKQRPSCLQFSGLVLDTQGSAIDSVAEATSLHAAEEWRVGPARGTSFISRVGEHLCASHFNLGNCRDHSTIQLKRHRPL